MQNTIKLNLSIFIDECSYKKINGPKFCLSKYLHSRWFSIIFEGSMRGNNMETILTAVCVLHDLFTVHHGLGKQ